VDAGDMGVVELPEERADAGSPIGANRPVAVVAEAGHQHRPRPRDALDPPPWFGRLVAEAIARQGRADEVERIVSVTAVRRRVAQRTDDLEPLDDGTGPAVGQHDRQRTRMRRADVQEVDPDSVDGRAELRDRVQARLRRPPVVVGSPVGTQLAQIAQRYTLGPVAHRFAFRPARPPEPFPEILEVGFRDPDAVRLQGCAQSGLTRATLAAPRV
jgi:hypothetical protein